MTDYIKAAVELADGFSWKEYDGWRCDHPLTFYYGTGKEPSQWFLDALAAQIVRQVDALAPDVTLSSGFHGECFIYREATDEDWIGGEMKGSGDRTMNTIKAIVDSGVLRTSEDASASG